MVRAAVCPATAFLQAEQGQHTTGKSSFRGRPPPAALRPAWWEKPDRMAARAILPVGGFLGAALLPRQVRLSLRTQTQLIIESAVGQGTTMRLVFPLAPRQGEMDVQPVEVEVRLRSLRILVVDDDPLIRQLLRDVLQVEGHVVTVVDGGRVGLEALQVAWERQEPFEVVLTDLGMPEMDGREVARSVKHAAPDTPVILLTGWGQALQQEGSLPPHVDVLLGKPPRPGALRAARRAVARPAGRKDNE